MLSSIRAFFSARQVLEVETPILSRAGTTDPAIESYRVDSSANQTRYLQTSPEFPMKRLLAAGVGDIYQIARVFRHEELGRQHNPEFSLLEWYRLGFDHHALMREVLEMLAFLLVKDESTLQVKKISYADLCLESLGIDVFTCDLHELKNRAKRSGLQIGFELDQDGWLDLLLSHITMPSLPKDQITFLYDYPVSQASLARLNPGGETAARFEVFWGGMELANGFYELQDAQEQRERFEADNIKRVSRGQAPVPIDEHLIAALSHGLPRCSGVALGLDRLLMKLTDSDHIQQVTAFPADIA